MSRRAYSPEEKAAALAALVAGQGLDEVARDYKIPVGTLKAWRHYSEGPVDPELAIAKRERVGELLMEYLEANLSCLTAQIQVFRDPEWLRKQDAHQAAIIHGVMADKATRLLEALRPRETPADPGSEPDPMGDGHSGRLLLREGSGAISQ